MLCLCKAVKLWLVECVAYWWLVGEKGYVEGLGFNGFGVQDFGFRGSASHIRV